jgi:hypothetical protein
VADLHDHVLSENRATQQHGGGANDHIQLDLHANSSSKDAVK